ncbi:hypothetical protein [Metabacillus sp. RGM 3146]|uniref:hypothetical protein n=1 Tax=Metabacillus sp. RGM 3146 TaxID=3401092 RepID=UPI003B9B0A28
MTSGLWTLHSKRLRKWSKLLLPTKHLRYYPPQFVLRNPVLEGVYSAVSNGKKVAVVVANLLSMKDLTQQLEPAQFQNCLQELKLALKKNSKLRNTSRMSWLFMTIIRMEFPSF